MIYVLWGQIPQKLDEDTAKILSERFGNKEYIAQILDRRNKESAKESLFSLSLLSECAAHRGVRLDGVKIFRSDSGQPRFDTERLKFSISHTKDHAVCALSDSGEDVGVDIEVIPKNDRWKAISERFFTEEEKRAAQHGGAQTFAEIWTAKEAYVKFSSIPLDRVLRGENMTSECHAENITHRLVGNCCLTVYSPCKEIVFQQCSQFNAKNL